MSALVSISQQQYPLLHSSEFQQWELNLADRQTWSALKVFFAYSRACRTQIYWTFRPLQFWYRRQFSHWSSSSNYLFVLV